MSWSADCGTGWGISVVRRTAMIIPQRILISEVTLDFSSAGGLVDRWRNRVEMGQNAFGTKMLEDKKNILRCMFAKCAIMRENMKNTPPLAEKLEKNRYTRKVKKVI
jgi:hypothetical protein